MRMSAARPPRVAHCDTTGLPADCCPHCRGRQFRLLVTGSRDWKDEDAIRQSLAAVITTLGPQNVTIVHGACPTGADALTDQIAGEWAGLAIERHPADWDHCAPGCPDKPHRVRKQPGDIHHPGELDDYCPGAGPRRNRHMVSLGADLCMPFPLPGSRGTKKCMRYARAAGIPIRRWTP